MARSAGSHWIGAGVLSGLVFAALLILFGLTFWTFVGSLAGFGAGLLIFAPRKRGEHDFKALGVDKEELKIALAGGHSILKIIRDENRRIESKTIRGKVDDIVDVAQRILDNIAGDPKDYRRARQFFSYYLDATVNIVRRYGDLSRRGLSDSGITRSLEKTEGTLDTLKRAYDRQLAILLEDDKMDLDTELELLERTIRLEGLGDDES